MEMSDETVTISKDLYDEISEMASRYLALTRYGVEEWSGYLEAMKFFGKLTYLEEMNRLNDLTLPGVDDE